MAPRTKAQKVVVFAYACDPDRGSEPGAGAALATLASKFSLVTVVTRSDDFDPDGSLLRDKLGVESVVRIPDTAVSRGAPLYLRYFMWCRGAARAIEALRRAQDIDVLHHATYASDWFCTPFNFLRKSGTERWVLGPVGGASYPSLRVARAVTGSLGAMEAVRSVSTKLSRQTLMRSVASSIDAALALNDESMKALTAIGFSDIRRTSNAVIDYDTLPPKRTPERTTVIFMGRGAPWKGLPLVLRASTHLPKDFRVLVMGPGTNTSKYQRASAGATCEVGFLGALPRPEALKLLASADVLAFPSLHDSAPWAAAEAAAMGVPTVCLPLGGVASMAGSAAVTVDLDSGRALDRRFAEALIATASMRVPASREFTEDALQHTLERAYLGSQR